MADLSRNKADFLGFLKRGQVPRPLGGLRGDFGVQWWRDFIKSLTDATSDIPGLIVTAGGGGAASGQWERIGTPTVAATQTNVDLALPTGYDAYRVRYFGVRPSLSGDRLVARFSTDGVTFPIIASYRYAGQVITGPNASPVETLESFDNTYFGIMLDVAGSGIGTASGEHASGIFEITTARSATLMTMVRSDAINVDAAGEDTAQHLVSGFHGDVEAHVAVRFTMFTSGAQSAGTISVGTFILEGLKT